MKNSLPLPPSRLLPTGVPEIWKFTNTSLWVRRTEQSAGEQPRTGGQSIDRDSESCLLYNSALALSALSTHLARYWGLCALCWAEQQRWLFHNTWPNKFQAFANTRVDFLLRGGTLPVLRWQSWKQYFSYLGIFKSNLSKQGRTHFMFYPSQFNTRPFPLFGMWF